MKMLSLCISAAGATVPQTLRGRNKPLIFCFHLPMLCRKRTWGQCAERCPHQEGQKFHEKALTSAWFRDVTFTPTCISAVPAKSCTLCTSVIENNWIEKALSTQKINKMNFPFPLRAEAVWTFLHQHCFSSITSWFQILSSRNYLF